MSEWLINKGRTLSNKEIYKERPEGLALGFSIVCNYVKDLEIFINLLLDSKVCK